MRPTAARSLRPNRLHIIALIGVLPVIFTACDLGEKGGSDDTGAEDSGDGAGGADGGADGADGGADGADGGADGGDTGPLPVDEDGDGVTDLDGDCDDGDPAIFPGAPDIACDGIDQPCTGWADGVYGPEDDLQALADAAPDGATLCLMAGGWAQNLQVDGVRALTLRGAGRAETVLTPADGGRMIRAAGGATLRLEGLGFAAGETTGARGEEGLFDVADATLALSDVEVTGIGCGLAGGCPAALAQVGPAARFEADDLRVRGFSLNLGSGGAAQGLIYGGLGSIIRLERAELSDLRLRAAGTLAGGLLPSAPEGSVTLTTVSVVDSQITGDSSAYGVLGGARDLSWTEVSAQRLDFVFGSTVYLAVTQGGAGSTISHSDLRDLRVSGGTHTVGVYVNSGALTIENSRFADIGLQGSGGIGYGLLVSDNAGISLNYVTLLANTVSNGSADTAGLSCRNRSTCAVENSSFTWNDASAVLRSAAGAMSVDASSALTARYLHLWGNTGAYGETVNLASGAPVEITEAVLAEPNFVDLESRPSDWDLRLNPRSALIDAGDPAARDADGSRADIGSYGGPNGR